MKMLYLDSSVVVSVALSERKRSQRAIEHMKKASKLISSELVVVEAQAGISLACDDQPAMRAETEQNLNRILTAIALSSVDSVTLGHARSLVKRYRTSIGLRAMDAIHLASANLIRDAFADSTDFALTYLTADRKQHAAFTAEGHIGECLE